MQWQGCYTCRDYARHRREVLAGPLTDKAMKADRDIIEVVDEFMNNAHERHLDGTPLRDGGPTTILDPALIRLATFLGITSTLED